LVEENTFDERNILICFGLMRVEAESLIGAITLSAENAAVANGEIKALVKKPMQGRAVPSVRTEIDQSPNQP